MTAITRRDYDRWNADQWKGKRVRSRRPLVNGWAEMPAGTVFTVEDKFKGFALRSEPCPHCGVRLRINRVEIGALELVDAT